MRTMLFHQTHPNPYPIHSVPSLLKQCHMFLRLDNLPSSTIFTNTKGACLLFPHMLRWHCLLRLEGLRLGQSLHEFACKGSLQAWHGNISTDNFQPFQLHCQLWDVNVWDGMAKLQHFFTIERLLDLDKITIILISFTTTKKLAQVCGY